MGASPGAAVALYGMNIGIDIRHLLPVIQVPTLILHRSRDKLINETQGGIGKGFDSPGGFAVNKVWGEA